MLKIQQYLQTNTIESLEHFGIFAKYHPTEPIVILDYDQIESSKFKEHQLVKECRGIKLSTVDYSICQKGFDRFFNLLETADTTDFVWEHFSSTKKEDGSLIMIRAYDKCNLFVTTRNSFADSICGESGKSWKELVLSCLSPYQQSIIKSNPTFTYVFELLSPFNTVVEYHPEPKLVLLSIFDHGDGFESTEIINLFHYCGFESKKQYNFNSMDSILAELDTMNLNKSIEEGFVVKDMNGIRLKCKNKFYLQLHRLSGNGNIATIKELLPIILSGEKDEILNYFPYLKSRIEEFELIIADLFTDLYVVWKMCKDIEDQKTFAICIKDITPFSGILFGLKKQGNIHDFNALKHEWSQSSDIILKVLK
jgi:hypothetical protein